MRVLARRDGIQANARNRNSRASIGRDAAPGEMTEQGAKPPDCRQIEGLVPAWPLSARLREHVWANILYSAESDGCGHIRAGRWLLPVRWAVVVLVGDPGVGAGDEFGVFEDGVVGGEAAAVHDGHRGAALDAELAGFG